MSNAILEHVNVTVSDPDKTADLLVKLFGWHVRWHGASMDNGRTVHVGTEDSYLALYSPEKVGEDHPNNYVTLGGLNHIAVVVNDLDEVEKSVLALGIKTHNHGDYDPGRRFYFNDQDDIEYEVVEY
jgi:catechol 2,3-dioxygenase-like lactoylglutathione lyase family enzyme